MKNSIKLVYNEGLGFTEYTKYFDTLLQASIIEKDILLDAHVYRNGKRIFI